MSSSESDSDDLFYYSNRHKIQEQCTMKIIVNSHGLVERRLSETNVKESLEIKSIFVDDDDDELNLQDSRTSPTRGKRNRSDQSSTPKAKEIKIDPSQVLAEFDKSINMEVQKSLQSSAKYCMCYCGNS